MSECYYVHSCCKFWGRHPWKSLNCWSHHFFCQQFSLQTSTIYIKYMLFHLQIPFIFYFHILYDNFVFKRGESGKPDSVFILRWENKIIAPRRIWTLDGEKSWFENLWDNRHNPDYMNHWRENFRMLRRTSEKIVNLLPGSLEKQLVTVALWGLANWVKLLESESQMSLKLLTNFVKWLQF